VIIEEDDDTLEWNNVGTIENNFKKYTFSSSGADDDKSEGDDQDDTSIGADQDDGIDDD